MKDSSSYGWWNGWISISDINDNIVFKTFMRYGVITYWIEMNMEQIFDKMDMTFEGINGSKGSFPILD